MSSVPQVDLAPRCPRCGVPLATATDPCLACLLKTGLDDVNASQPFGDRIGPYRLLELLGEGGMGVVYLAEQEEPIRRRVALKVIKLGMDTRAVVSRFESERQALALMDHPNIARVIDAGATPDGRPFFVMEHIAGTPVTEYCDLHQLSVRKRLDLLLDVCSAIQHAHQKGVIHRDLKPSNVLVTLQDGRAVPKVIDFGVAKATGAHLAAATFFTEHGLLIGTPEYMSPEQASLSSDIDTTTDVYSLGVLAYELLVGALPFDPQSLRDAGYDGMLRVIRESEPPRPSSRLMGLGPVAAEVAARRQADPSLLVRQLRGDLDWILLRAIDKDRRRRYASASELAADLSRHLTDDPVSARPPSAVYRVRKFVVRHRGFVMALALVCAALTIGFVVSLGMYVRAEGARREADAQRYGVSLLAAESALNQLDAVSGDAATRPIPDVLMSLLSPPAGAASLDRFVAACAAFTQQAEIFVQTEFSVQTAGGHAAITRLNDRALELDLRAKDQCVKAMELRLPGIARRLIEDPTRALKPTTVNDVELLYWTAASWSRAIALGMSQPELVIDLPVVRAIAERAMALDDTWHQGALHELMIAIESLPESLGGSKARARQHFARAVELEHGRSPAPYVALAAGVALASNDRSEFEQLLKTALAIEPSDSSPTGNAILMFIYQRRARTLLDEVNQLFAKSPSM